MKKVLIFLAIALTGNCSFGQTLQKGNVLGLHITVPNLKDGVSMEDYTNFFTGKMIPAYEKAFPGVKAYLIKSLRGQDEGSMGVIFIFSSEAARNKYFNDDGTLTKLGNEASAKMGDADKEEDKYVTSSTGPDKYNDWLVE